MNKFDFNIEQLFKFDYGGTPKFDRMVKPGTKLHKVLSKSGDEDILSKLKSTFPKKQRKKKKQKTQRKKGKKKSIRNKSIKKTNTK